MLVQCRQQKCEEECDYWSYRASLTVGKVFNPIIAENMQEYWRLPEGMVFKKKLRKRENQKCNTNKHKICDIRCSNPIS